MDLFEGLLRKSAACCWTVVQMGLDGWFCGKGWWPHASVEKQRTLKRAEIWALSMTLSHGTVQAGTEMDQRTCGEWTRLDGGMDRSTRHQPKEGSGVAADRLGKQGG